MDLDRISTCNWTNNQSEPLGNKLTCKDGMQLPLANDRCQFCHNLSPSAGSSSRSTSMTAISIVRNSSYSALLSGSSLKACPTQETWLWSAIKPHCEWKQHRGSGCGRLNKREPVPFFKFSSGTMQILLSFPYLQKGSLLAYLKIFYVQNKLDLVYARRCTVAYHSRRWGIYLSKLCHFKHT